MPDITGIDLLFCAATRYTLNDSSRQNIEQSDNALISRQNLMIDAYRATAQNPRYTLLWGLIVVRC